LGGIFYTPQKRRIGILVKILYNNIMKLIKQEKLNKKIVDKFDYDFILDDDGLYLIEIIASAKSWWQNLKSFKSLLNDDDLALSLDRMEISTSSSNETNARSVWHGNELKGFLKTVVTAIKLKKGKHTLSFTPDQKPYLKSIMISQPEETDKITYIPVDNNPAQKGNGRPWLSFILINLSGDFRIMATTLPISTMIEPSKKGKAGSHTINRLTGSRIGSRAKGAMRKGGRRIRGHNNHRFFTL